MVERALLPNRLDAGPVADAELPADRIFLRNYIRKVEIGAYSEEVGVTQKLRRKVLSPSSGMLKAFQTLTQTSLEQ